jgi:predicted RNA-binding protein associated with RNAse of E/G family
VNLQDPVRRTERGFDTLDHILDVFAGHDLSWWQLKDEHELIEAVELGVVTRERAHEIRDVAAHIGTVIDNGEAWWTPWSDWEPDHTWPVPALPQDWNTM